jgi:uncharacterized protein YbbC (DUF1343 family)
VRRDYDKGQDNEGGAFVYKGDPSGLTLTAVTFESNQANAKMGYSVASAGDFNGDGFSDVLVGAPFYDGDQIDEGITKLYLGSGSFFTSVPTSYSFGNDHLGALVGVAVQQRVILMPMDSAIFLSELIKVTSIKIIQELFP